MMQDEALGIITSHTYAASLDRPQNKAFVEAFRKAHNRDPSYYAEGMYSAAMWIDQALAKTGVPKDPLDLINAVKSIELTDAPRGALKIDDHNSTIETVYIRNTVKTESGGMINEVIDKIARAFPKASDIGFETEMAAFGLNFCHGIGLGLHERPIISRLNSFDDPMELSAGMMFAVETYCPASDGVSAARIEEEVIVTPAGAQIITLFPADELPIANRY